MRSIDVDIGWRGGTPKLLLRRSYVCAECRAVYRPIVRGARRLLLFIPFLALVAVILLLVVSQRQLIRPLAFVLVLLLTLLVLFAPRWLELVEPRQAVERPVFRRGSGSGPKSGAIVLECPRCGSDEARPLGNSPAR